MKGSVITKRATEDKETPQKGEGKKKRRTRKERTMELMDSLTGQIVKPPGTPTPIMAAPETQITELMLPPIPTSGLPSIPTLGSASAPTPRPAAIRQAQLGKAKAKAKAKPTVVKRNQQRLNKMTTCQRNQHNSHRQRYQHK